MFTDEEREDERKREKNSLVQRANWSPRLHTRQSQTANETVERPYLITRVPGIGGASIHWFCLFRTWSAWISGSCHKIVKHCVSALSVS